MKKSRFFALAGCMLYVVLFVAALVFASPQDSFALTVAAPLAAIPFIGMAKVTGPLMSIDARGKLANSIVFMAWKGINTVRQWVKPANPNTAAQQAIRQDFTTAVSKYHSLLAPDTIAWAARAAGQAFSGFNLFVKKVVDALQASKTWALLSDISATTITATGFHVEGTSDNAALVHVKVGTAPGVYSLVFDEPAGRTLPGAFDVTITGLTSGVKYYYQVYVTPSGSLDGESGEYSATTS